MPEYIESPNLADFPNMESGYTDISPGMAFAGKCPGCGNNQMFVVCHKAADKIFGYLQHVDENGEFVDFPEEVFREVFSFRILFRESVEALRPGIRPS
jgi:hypothetical protein